MKLSASFNPTRPFVLSPLPTAYTSEFSHFFPTRAEIFAGHIYSPLVRLLSDPGLTAFAFRWNVSGLVLFPLIKMLDLRGFATYLVCVEDPSDVFSAASRFRKSAHRRTGSIVPEASFAVSLFASEDPIGWPRALICFLLFRLLPAFSLPFPRATSFFFFGSAFSPFTCAEERRRSSNVPPLFDGLRACSPRLDRLRDVSFAHGSSTFPFLACFSCQL